MEVRFGWTLETCGTRWMEIDNTVVAALYAKTYSLRKLLLIACRKNKLYSVLAWVDDKLDFLGQKLPTAVLLFRCTWAQQACKLASDAAKSRSGRDAHTPFARLQAVAELIFDFVFTHSDNAQNVSKKNSLTRFDVTLDWGLASVRAWTGSPLL